MSSKVTGFGGATMVEDGHDFDPQSGDFYFQVWEGPKRAILYKTQQFRAAAWRVSRRKARGAVHAVTASIPLLGTGVNETPYDRWRITTEHVVQDIRSNVKLMVLANGDEATLNIWVAQIKKWFKDQEKVENKINSYPSAWSAAQQQLADLIAQGVENFETKRPVLSRIRSVSANYANQFVMEAVPKFYSSAALINGLGIPKKVSLRMAPDPATKPVDTQWGWMWRQQDSDVVVYSNRVEEVISFTFAAWSTLMFDYVS